MRILKCSSQMVQGKRYGIPYNIYGFSGAGATATSPLPISFRSSSDWEQELLQDQPAFPLPHSLPQPLSLSLRHP